MANQLLGGWIVGAAALGVGGLVVVGGCAPRAKPLIGPGAVRPPALADRADEAGEAGDESIESDGTAAGSGPDAVAEPVAIDPEGFDVFRASSFARGDGHRLVSMVAGGDCANRMGAQTLRFLAVEQQTRGDGMIERTTRLMRHAQEDNPLITRVEYGGAGGGWSMVQAGFVEELQPLRTHREVFVPDGVDGSSGGVMRLLATTNHERGSTLWFVADPVNGEDGHDGLVMNPALSESAAVWRTARVIEGEQPSGEPTGTARLRSWIAGESSGTDLPAGLVVMTELRIELGGAVLEREVARVYAQRDGVVMMRFERAAERTRVMGFGGGMRCEYGVMAVDVVGR